MSFTTTFTSKSKGVKTVEDPGTLYGFVDKVYVCLTIF